uniref:C2H2-type domain-containing protein n=2 Tax=Ascaris TaxID=6251 RepID=A0A9J2PHR1_ASCLU
MRRDMEECSERGRWPLTVGWRWPCPLVAQTVSIEARCVCAPSPGTSTRKRSALRMGFAMGSSSEDDHRSVEKTQIKLLVHTEKREGVRRQQGIKVTFASSSTRERLLRNVTMAMEDMNACAECGFTTNNFAEFTEHIEQHESEQQRAPSGEPTNQQEWSEDADDSPNLSPEQSPLASGVLSLSLSPVSGLNAPAKSSKTVHSCPHCNFTTFMSQHMKSHLEAHERHQGQMYQCDICHMQFSQKANMHRHRMRHSGVKPYQCRYCLKRFFRKDQMQEHSMTHIKTGADFDCPVAMCQQQFSQHAGLRTHLDEAHAIAPSSPASCKRCSLLFANSRRLLLHYQTKHDEGDTSGVVVVPSASINTVKSENTLTAPVAKKRRASIPRNLTVAQNISAAIHQQLKLIQQDSLALSTDKNPVCYDCDQNPYTVSNEELLMSLSNTAIPSIFTDVKAEAAMQLWTREGNSGSENTEEQSHSPSVDSGSSAVDGETCDKEQQECLHCGVIFLDQTLYLLHKGLHSDSDPWKCNLCGHACGDKYMFTTHVISSDHSC